MKKIVITGPESTGKTMLTELLAVHFDLPWVQEYARTYLAELPRGYEQHDLLTMAKGQRAWEDATAKTGPKWLLCDTDLLTIQVWSEFKYGDCDDEISTALADHPADLYLLCAPDYPWEPDPQRENPDDREELYELYEEAIEALSVPYEVITGIEEERFDAALEAIQHHFGN